MTMPILALQRWRLVVLVFVGIIELVMVLLLRSQGLKGTIDSLGWLASGILLMSPLCIAAALLVYRGGKYSVRALLCTTALVAIFVSSLLPIYVRERSSRSLYKRLLFLNVSTSTESSLDERYKNIGYARTHRPKVQPAETPLWIAPLVNGQASVRVEDVQQIRVRTDEQIFAVLEMSDRLINLREITVFGGIQHGGAISTNAISALAKNLPAIESLSFIGVETLQPCFSQFAGIRYLTVFAVNAKGIADLTHEQARDIAATHGLEILSIGNYRLDNDSISILAEADDLRHLDLVRTSAKSETGLELELEKVRPQISIRILQ